MLKVNDKISKRWIKNIIALFIGCFVAFIVGELILRSFFYNLIVYRPDGILSTEDSERGGHFKKNAILDMVMPHGDLATFANNLNIDFDIQPRRVRFKVDSLGFRNDNDYKGEKYILVGDSFIVGSGNDQEYILSTQLRKKYDIESYNMAHFGSLEDYVKKLSYFKKNHNNFKIILFFFEGNDFPYKKIRKTKKSLIEKVKLSIYQKIYNYCKNSYLMRFTYRMYYKIYYHKSQRVTMRRINEHKILFYKNYINATRRKTILRTKDFEQLIESIKNEVEYIFFIPTKYRVYYDFIKEESQITLPNANWDYLNSLAKRFNFRAINLTEQLVAESKKILNEQNKLTYWKDDTHWNKYGISVVARIIYELVDNPNSIIQLSDKKDNVPLINRSE